MRCIERRQTASKDAENLQGNDLDTPTTDSSKKVLDVGAEDIAHAKNAVKWFQALIDNVYALNDKIKSDDSLGKPAQRARQNACHLDDWGLPFTRKKKKEYAKDLVRLISWQAMRVGISTPRA